MMQAILGNAAHPEYGVATIPFPIPRAEYANCVALLEALEISDARDRDCQVQEIRGPWPALKRLEEQLVNLDQFEFAPGVRFPRRETASQRVPGDTPGY